MKRRFGMLIGIICILIVGVSVTRMTKDFVVSKGVAASSILGVIETAVEAEAPAERINITVGMTSGPGAGALDETAAASDLSAEHAVITAEPEAAPAAVMEGGLAYSEETDDLEQAAEVLEDTEPEAIQETVKSPLDPAVTENAALVEAAEMETAYAAEDFFARFEDVEETSVKLWDNITADNVVAYYAAAEQERVLWDYELNLVYGEIRENLSEEEAEELKHLELDWMKERDQYAERMAAKSPILNAQNQNPVYTRALAEKTKERCYWLVAEYEDVLNHEETSKEYKIDLAPAAKK